MLFLALFMSFCFVILQVNVLLAFQKKNSLQKGFFPLSGTQDRILYGYLKPHLPVDSWGRLGVSRASRYHF